MKPEETKKAIIFNLEERIKSLEGSTKRNELLMEEATIKIQEQYDTIARLEQTLLDIVHACDNQNPTHEDIWRLAYYAIYDK